jgi:hypothetical protein
MVSDSGADMRKQSHKIARRPPALRGRPTLYSLDSATRICERIAHGESLIQISKGLGMPRYSTIMQWLRMNSDFADMYRQAREDQADALADEIIKISDDVEGETDSAKVQAARLRVDARKWVASKLKPKAYGERVEAAISANVAHTGPRRSTQEIAMAVLSLIENAKRTATPEQAKLIESKFSQVMSSDENTK